jgi:hypothetical protein
MNFMGNEARQGRGVWKGFPPRPAAGLMLCFRERREA